MLAFLDAVVAVVTRNKSLLAALGHAAATTTPKAPDQEPVGDHPVYRSWHGHLSALIAEQRPDLDAELFAHLLLGSLQSDPVLRLMEQGEGQRIADGLRELATSVVDR
jgi:hypothetical protein